MKKTLFKRILSFAMSLIMLISCMNGIVFAATSKTKADFSDISGHWAENYIEYLSQNNIISGYEDNTFRPNSNISRCEFTKILITSVPSEDKGINTYFKDVDPYAWYYDVVMKAASAGLVNGADGYFRPNDFITRQDIATIIARALLSEEELKEYEKLPNNAADKDDISSYALAGINFCMEKGYIKGYEDKTIKPKNTATRSEVCALLYRLITSTSKDSEYIFTSSDGVKILEFSNAKLSENSKLMKNIEKIISFEKPDILIFNGNFILSSSEEKIDEIISYIDSLNVKWAFTFGNEDYTLPSDRDYILNKAYNSKNCINNNQNIIKIQNSSEKLIKSIFLFDTDSLGITKSQINILETKYNEYKEKNPTAEIDIYAPTYIPQAEDMFYSGNILNGNGVEDFKAGNENGLFTFAKKNANVKSLYFSGNDIYLDGTYENVKINLLKDTFEDNEVNYNVIEETAVNKIYNIKEASFKDNSYSPVIGIDKSDDLQKTEKEKQPISSMRKEYLLNLFENFKSEELKWIASLQAPNGAIPMTLRGYNNDAKIVPYFSDMAAIALLEEPELYKDNVKAYIDWHFDNINTADEDPNGIDGTIFDYFIYYKDDGTVTQELIKDSNGNYMYYDSTDAYAAQFMKVLWDYYEKTGDDSVIVEHVNDIDRITNAMLATLDNGLTYATPTYLVKYCMDNLEVYRGLDNLCNIYKYVIVPSYDKNSPEFEKASAKLEENLKYKKTVFDAIEKKLWKKTYYDPGINDRNESMYNPFSWDIYYPHAMAQVQPVIMGIMEPTSKRAETLYNKFTAHYSKEGRRWETMSMGELFGSSDLSILAAKMGDIDKIETFIKTYIEKFSNTGRLWPCYNNDAALAVLGCVDAIKYIEENMIEIPDADFTVGIFDLSREFRLNEEFTQIVQEGYAINKSEFVKKIADAKNDPAKTLLVYEQMNSLPIKTSFKYIEPENYNDILLQSGADLGTLQTPSDDIMKDKILAAWQGKIAGIALGIPVEGWNYKDIKTYMEKADAWPIDDFLPDTSRANEENGLYLNNTYMCKGNFAHMPSDDDLRYAVINTNMVKLYGTTWDSWDMGKHWLYGLPFRLLCTAERIAYTNFSVLDEKYMVTKPSNAQELVKQSAKFGNPYREWIGAQIRSDAFGISAAGNPRLAAKMAYNDASLSHIKNGVYGEMFYAAMMSAAFCETDINKVIDRAFNEIPRNSRLYEALSDAVQIGKNSKSIDELASTIYKKYSSYNSFHVIPNAVICLASIVYSGGDTTKGILTAVACGFDSDCNPGTVGGILGAFNGTSGLDEKFVTPFNNTFSHGLDGFPTKITEIANVSFDTFKKVQSEN